MGRFTQSDPLSLKIALASEVKKTTGQTQQQVLSNPQLLNSYAYTANNPVKYTDPDGEFLGIALAIVGAIFFYGAQTAYSPGLDFQPPQKEVTRDFGDILPGWNEIPKLGRMGIGMIGFGGIVGKIDSKVSNIVERLATKLDKDVAERLAGRVEDGFITFYHGTRDYFKTIEEGIKGIKGLHFTDDVTVAGSYAKGWSGLEGDAMRDSVKWKFSVDEFVNFVERGLVEIDPNDINNGFRSFSKEVLDKVNQLIIKK